MFGSRVRLSRAIILIVLVFASGIGGYILIEGYTPLEAIYMTVITVGTVGFSEVKPLSDTGKIFTSILILVGVGTFAFAFGAGIEYLLVENISGLLARQRMQQAIDRLSDHVIICGYGRVGQSAAVALHDARRKMVVIDRQPEALAKATHEGLLMVNGDATNDDILREAGIDRAGGLIVCTGDDSLNLFIVLSARVLKPELYIVARSIDPENEGKMRRAGANRVVSPYQIGGRHMANIIVRPHVTDFFDVVTLNGGIELWIEELIIPPDSILAGTTVGSADIRHRTGVTLVALLQATTRSTIMPTATTELQSGDQLIVLGTREQLAALQKLAMVKENQAN